MDNGKAPTMDDDDDPFVMYEVFVPFYRRDLSACPYWTDCGCRTECEATADELAEARAHPEAAVTEESGA
jgi:hypothetical protein